LLHNSDPLQLKIQIAPNPQFTPQPVAPRLEENNDVQPIIKKYAQRHYQRAIQYAHQANWTRAVEELRDAIKLEPKNSDYHALLGVVHWQQKFPGMATVYIRQALKLNPEHPLALKYAEKLNIQPGKNATPKSMATSVSIAALLSFFLTRPRS
jgi:Tfp pilus assembly protein PilF